MVEERRRKMKNRNKGMKKDEERGSETRKRKDGMRKKDSRRKKEALREEGQCQGRKFPEGLWELPHSPSRRGEGQKDLGPLWIFLSSFYWRKQSSPQPGGELQNSARTSQNFWEGSFSTFLQPTPNPKISEYLEVLGWKSRFSCVKDRVCIPPLGGETGGDTCEQEDDEGVWGKSTLQRCRKWGAEWGSQTPEDLGGIGYIPIPVLEGLQ